MWFRLIVVAVLFLIAPKQALASKVTMVTTNQTHIAVTHPQGTEWLVNDRLCVIVDNNEVACGAVTRSTLKGAIVKITTRKDNIEKGAMVAIESNTNAKRYLRINNDPLDWFDLRNITIGIATMSPYIHLQQTITSNIAIGTYPIYLSADVGAGTLRGGGIVGTINYYGGKTYEGLWIQLGGAAYLFSAEANGEKDTGAALGAQVLAGWRWAFASKINLGASIGPQYLYVFPVAVDLRFSGWTPLISLDFGVIF